MPLKEKKKKKGMKQYNSENQRAQTVFLRTEKKISLMLTDKEYKADFFGEMNQLDYDSL